MKRVFVILVVSLFLLSSVSAEILFTKQPNELYNLGDKIFSSVKVKTLENSEGSLNINLICNGIETEIYKEYLVLSAGEEISRTPTIPLIKSFIGHSTGTCKLKATFGEELILTNEFKISNEIIVSLKSEEREFYPEQEIVIEFDATKEGGSLVDGFVNVTVEMKNSAEGMKIFDSVNKGYGYITFEFPKQTPSEQYLVKVNVFEKDSTGEITNKGFANFNIKILQVPTTLEIVLENEVVEPGTSAKTKAVLLDQTGVNMESTAILTIESSKNKTVKRAEVATEEYLEVPIVYNEPPSTWKIYAESNELEEKKTFEISEKSDLDIEIVNKTLIVTNVGNVKYNDTIQIDIENTTLDLDVELGVDEEAKYVLTAPDGNYNIAITEKNGESFNQGVFLTGKVISVEEASRGIAKVISHPISWIFMLLILCAMAFIFFRKGYNKKFVGYITKKKGKSKIIPSARKESLFNTKNEAGLSLSIKGEKQDTTLVCLKIKNLSEVKTKRGQLKETLQKLSHIADENKIPVYEDREAIFFLFIPAITKTFQNKEKAIKIASQIKKILDEHNKLFKDKIDFGISLNSGMVVAKYENNKLEFMSIGSLMVSSKRMSTHSDKTIYLSENIKENLPANIKLEKHESNGLTFYTIKEIKDRESNQKFINNFIKRLENSK